MYNYPMQTPTGGIPQNYPANYQSGACFHQPQGRQHSSSIPHNQVYGDQYMSNNQQGFPPQISTAFSSGHTTLAQSNPYTHASYGVPSNGGPPLYQTGSPPLTSLPFNSFQGQAPSSSNFPPPGSSFQAPQRGSHNFQSIARNAMAFSESQQNRGNFQPSQDPGNVPSNFAQNRALDSATGVPFSPAQDGFQEQSNMNALEQKVAELQAQLNNLSTGSRSRHMSTYSPPRPPPVADPVRSDLEPQQISEKQQHSEPQQASEPKQSIPEEQREAQNGPVTEPSSPVDGPDERESQGSHFENKQEDTKKRFRMFVSKYDPGKDKREEVEIDLPEADQKTASIVTYRKFMDADDVKRCLYEELEIESSALKSLLSKSMLHVEDEFFEAAYAKETSPFDGFVFNWNRLIGETEPHESDNEELIDARKDLKDIMYAISISEPRKMKQYFKERDQYFSTKTISFAHLWTLFGWGTKVYARPFLDDLQMFEVKSNSGYRDSAGVYVESDESYDRYNAYDVRCSAFDWDGNHFRRYTYAFTIDKFEGRRLISSLPCFPTEYYVDEDGHQDDSKLREKLLHRGRQFVQLCTVEEKCALRRYAGPVLEVNLYPRNAEYGTPSGIPVKQRELMDQDVIIDNYAFVTSQRNQFTYFSGHPVLGSKEASFDPADCPCRQCHEGPTRAWQTKKFTSRVEEGNDFAESDDRLLLCPAKVLGYVPTKKLWAQFRVECITEISEEAKRANESRFEDQLELDENTKNMLRALITHHQARKDALMLSESSKYSSPELDPIEGKGRGLAILLHGPPGVGKTLTAEAVALATGKPLLPVSVAEIGTEPPEAESKLMDVFADASRWNAVLLIDEADVFLEERVGFQDIKRNTLVSVLLRVLEYYDGIIILTTNRISSLDVAVQSRMHLAIQYSDLTKEQKFKIFKQFLDKVKSEIADRRAIDTYLETICRKAQLNGRQIRNIVSSAQAMAHNEQRKLSKDHISEIYEATEAFIDCLKDLTTTRRARNEAVR